VAAQLAKLRAWDGNGGMVHGACRSGRCWSSTRPTVDSIRAPGVGGRYAAAVELVLISGITRTTSARRRCRFTVPGP
jgi:hypothetical protein